MTSKEWWYTWEKEIFVDNEPSLLMENIHDAIKDIEAVEQENVGLRRTLVEAVMPLEVLAAQIAVKPYAELTEDFQKTITETVLHVRAILGGT